MATVTPALVKELRDRTGLGMMDCKQALIEATGDIELAIDNLRKSSRLKAASKASRIAAEGLLGLKIADDGLQAALVEVNVETDFAARNELFIAFVDTVAKAAYKQQTTDIQALLDAGLEEARQNLVQEIGENISIRRIAIMSTTTGKIGAYLHGNRLMGALVELSNGSKELGKDIAMHVVAAKPQVIKAADVPEEILAKEKEIYGEEARRSGKPEQIIEKIIGGRISKFLNEISLLEQGFIKDNDKKVGRLLQEAGAEVYAFERFEVSEGIERRATDFASEVKAAMQSS